MWEYKNNIKYDPERNEVFITSCRDCAFLVSIWSEKFAEYDFLCRLTETLIDEDTYLDGYPENCPIKNPNFKFTRKLKD